MSASTIRARVITLTTAIICGIGLWLIFERASQKVDDKLVKVMNLLETVEMNLDKSIAELPKELPKKKELPEKDDANAALVEERNEREDEIIRLRRELSELRKQTKDQRNKFLLLKKEKTREVTALENNLSRIQERNEQEMRAVRTKKDKKIRRLEDKNRKLEQTKAIAIPILIDALSHPDVEIRTGASRALTTMTGVSLSTDQERWRNWWRRNRSAYIQSR